MLGSHEEREGDELELGVGDAASLEDVVDTLPGVQLDRVAQPRPKLDNSNRRPEEPILQPDQRGDQCPKPDSSRAPESLRRYPRVCERLTGAAASLAAIVKP